MRVLVSKSPDDIHLFLKRLLHEQHITGEMLAERTGISYHKLIRTLRNEREFTASEIGTIARKLGIEDINKYFLGGRA